MAVQDRLHNGVFGGVLRGIDPQQDTRAANK